MRSLAPLALVVFFTAGCVPLMMKARKEQLQNRLDPLVGQPEEMLIMRLGAPAQVVHLQTADVYRYVIAYDTVTSVDQNAFGPPSVSTRDRYDQIDVVVRNGKVATYQVAVVR